MNVKQPQEEDSHSSDCVGVCGVCGICVVDIVEEKRVVAAALDSDGQ
jgi:hypothetical protein